MIRRASVRRLSRMLSARLAGTCVIALGLAACATSRPVVSGNVVGPARPRVEVSAQQSRKGELVVYSGTRASVVEQSEYPIHTDYVLMDSGGKVLRRVENTTGSFGAHPVVLLLATGAYRVKAQDQDGHYVIVPVVIEAGQRTVVNLDLPAMSRSTP